VRDTTDLIVKNTPSKPANAVLVRCWGDDWQVCPVGTVGQRVQIRQEVIPCVKRFPKGDLVLYAAPQEREPWHAVHLSETASQDQPTHQQSLEVWENM
jgi:hypothetical protein